MNRNKKRAKKPQWFVYEFDPKEGWFNPHVCDSDGDHGSERYPSLAAAQRGYVMCRVTKDVYSLHYGIACFGHKVDEMWGLLVRRGAR